MEDDVQNSTAQEGEFPLPLLSFCGWTNNTIDTSKINRRKKKQQSLIHVQGSLIDMELKKWPKQLLFILFRQRKNTREELTGQSYFSLGCSISDQSKQSLGLG